MLLPKKLPNTETLTVNAYYKSHGQVGGDYYDFIPINNHEWICCMADVSGKGVSAAFLMAGLQAQLRSLIEMYGNDLEKIISSLNRKVLESAQGEKFVTFFIGHYNEINRGFSYINCGHNPPFLYNDLYPQWLNATYPALGIVDEYYPLKNQLIEIPIDSQLLLYTDGLVEVENEMLIPFGENGIQQAFERYQKGFSNDSLMDSVHQFIGKMKFIDDIALLHIVIQ
jgi:phosphoserine phosphatase RsbU/P